MVGSATPTSKKLLQSKTIWGVIITAAPGLITQLGPLFGFPIPEDAATQIVGAATTIGGALFAVYGRKVATKVIE